MSKETNSPVYKLTTDKLQPVLINVPIRSILNTKISQNSVVTCSRCGGIFNNQFGTQSLLSLLVKEF